jgi:toxin ParE1/3/4
MTRLRHSSQARADLLEIWLGIAADHPTAADRTLDRLEQRLRILIDWPLAGAACPRISAEARILVEHPYVILYRLIPEAVQIVRFLHGARDIDAALFGEGLEE